jgi:hypothetical protein
VWLRAHQPIAIQPKKVGWQPGCLWLLLKLIFKPVTVTSLAHPLGQWLSNPQKNAEG